MRPWGILGLITIAAGALAFAAFQYLAPYGDARDNTREIAITPHLLFGFPKPYKPIAILSEKDLTDLLQRTRKECAALGSHPARDLSDLVPFQRSLQTFDYSKEALIIIPVHHGYDHEVGMSAPYLASRKLTCQVWSRDPRWLPAVHHPASQVDFFGVVVKKDSVDVVDVWIRSDLVASLALE